MGHAPEETKTAIFLPDGEHRTAKVLGYVELGVKVVPTGEICAGFEVKKDEKGGDENEGVNGPDVRKVFGDEPELFEGEAVFDFGDVLGHRLV